MSEPTQEDIYKLCGIEQSGWVVDRREETGDVPVNIKAPGSNQSGAQVALRWIAMLNGRPYTRKSDGPYDLYESTGSTLRVKVN